MKRIDTDLPEVLLIEPPIFHDERGFFMESFHRKKFRDLGIDTEFVQDNHSRSSRGVLRGLHFQLRSPQAKLCRVVRGKVLDVAVDIRVGSPTFGKWVSAILSDENHRMIFVPRGFAHGFYVFSEEVDFLYKCDALYDPQDQHGVLWNDAQIGIDWQIPNEQNPIVNHRDQAYLPLHKIPHEMLPKWEI